MDLPNQEEFRALIGRIARGWETNDPDLSLACFWSDAVYMEPPDVQLFIGHEQLRPYFAAVPPGTEMAIHRAWFDPASQSGAFEYTFGVAHRDRATHGLASVSLANGLIVEWCEFQREGPRAWEEFKQPGGKSWKWTAENYPPKSSAKL